MKKLYIYLCFLLFCGTFIANAVEITNKHSFLSENNKPIYGIGGSHDGNTFNKFNKLIRGNNILVIKDLFNKCSKYINQNFNGNYYIDAAINAYNKGDYKLSINYFTKAIEIDPNDVASYYCRGNAYILINKYKNAIADFTKVIQMFPKFSPAYNSRGFAYSDLGNYNDAIIDFNRAIQLDPDFDNAYFNRGKAYYDSHKYKQAIADYSRATQINPYYADAYYNRGLAYKKFGNQELAIADFNKACTLNKIYCK
jgi:tetratricopeptide (TPR) repeat protein